jgi:tricorn protease
MNYNVIACEIAVGQSYVRGDMPGVPQQIGGLLGADFAIENGRYKVTRISDNESWNPELRSPLATPGANVNTGDYILAINGIELRAPDNIHRLLDGTANRQTTLTVNSQPVMEGARTASN